MDRETAKQYAASIMGLAHGNLAEGARPDVQDVFDKALPETLLEARKALMASRQILSKTPAPATPAPEAPSESPEDAGPKKPEAKTKSPAPEPEPEPIEAPLPFLDEVGLPPVDDGEPPPPVKVAKPDKPIPAKPAAAAKTPTAPVAAKQDPFAGMTLDAGDLDVMKASEKPVPTARIKKVPEPAAPATKETAESMGLRNLFGALRDEKKSAFDDLLSDVAPTPEIEESPAGISESEPEDEPLDETADLPDPPVEEDALSEVEEDPLAGLGEDPLAGLGEDAVAPRDPDGSSEEDPLAGLLDSPGEGEKETDPLAGETLDFPEISQAGEDPFKTGPSAEEQLLASGDDPLGGLDLGDLTTGSEESAGTDPAPAEDPFASLESDGIPDLPDFDEPEEETPAPVKPAAKPKSAPPAPRSAGGVESTLSDDDILALTGSSDGASTLGPDEIPGSTPGETDVLDFGSLEMPGEETSETIETPSGEEPADLDPFAESPVEPEEPGAGEEPELPEVHSDDPDHLGGEEPSFPSEAQPSWVDASADAGGEAPTVAPVGEAFTLPESKEDEDPRLREAFIYLKTFSEANRRIVYDAVTSGLLSERESELVFRDLVDGRDEENLVRWIYDRLVEKHKLAPSAKAESRGPTEKVLLKANFWPMLRLALLGIVILALLIPGGIWVGKKIRAGSLYSSGLKEIEARHYPEAESDFSRAFELSPSLKQTRKYAERYIARGRFVDAEEKYRLALTLKPEDFDTLLDWARLSIRKEDYPDAMARLTKLDRQGKGPDVVREEMVRALVEWGRTDPVHYAEADKMLNTLLLRKPKSLPYMGRKMQVASLEGRYPQARGWYGKIQEEDAKYVDPEMFGDFLQMLVDRYERQHKADPLHPGKKTPPAGFQDDQLYLVKNIEKVGRDIYGKSKEDIALYWNMARWKRILSDGPKARRWAEEGAATYERLGSPRVFQASRLYTLLGDILLDEGKVNDAAARYTTALEMDPENPVALYRMGRVQLEQLDQLSNAYQSFQKARLHWKDPEGLDYAGLLHGLSFTSYFLDGGVGDETAETPARSNLTQALRYWTELKDNVGPNYLVEYALGAVYVRMGEPQLAWGVQGSAIQDLSRHLKEYHDNVNYVTRDLRQRMEILSDLYNNQAVAELALADRGRDAAIHRRAASRLLIDSIELKEKLGLARGAPTANFYNLRGGGKGVAEGWRLSDARIPKRMDFVSGQAR